MKKILIYFIFTASFSGCYAFGNNILYDSLKKGAGIRPLSMGNTFTAVAEGSDSIYYNPAGLSSPGGEYIYEVMDRENKYYSDFHSQRVYISPMAYAGYMLKDKDSSYVDVKSFGFAQKGRTGINWGVSYKTVTAKLPSYKSTGWSCDLGILAAFSPNLSFGIAAKDLIKKDVKVPTTFTSGFALFNKTKDFILAIDLVQNREDEVAFFMSHTGIEYKVTDGFTLRFGYYNNKITSGVSLILPFIKIDYGAVKDIHDNEDIMYMLGFRVGKGLMPAKNTAY
ncbi:MAG: hypothetical protein GY730_10715 [bacterium]|nr:hypothetical protein [bacterium]